MANETGPDPWSLTLAPLGEDKGFFRHLGPRHKAMFVRQNDTLVVTFDNLDDVRQDSSRLPWGVDFITSQGWSSLGLMAHGSTWYRDEAVLDFFDEMRDSGFFRQFRRVVFYGTSMGGYAACAFSSSAPGSTVVAINPQATLSRDRARWERRFRPAWRQDFSGRYGFAPDEVRHAERIWLFHDPTILADSMHAALFSGPQLESVACPAMGHGMLSLWRDMGVLKAIAAGCIDGTMTRHDLNRLLRSRHGSLRYQKMLMTHLVKTGQHKLVVRLCEWVLRQRPGPKYRRAMTDARAALARHQSRTASEAGAP